MRATGEKKSSHFRDLDSLPKTHPQEVNFRQNPTFEDCYPSSTKEYKEVVHEGTGTVLRVSSEILFFLFESIASLFAFFFLAHASLFLLAARGRVLNASRNATPFRFPI